MKVTDEPVNGDMDRMPVKVVEAIPYADRRLLLTFSTGENRFFNCNDLKGEAFQLLQDDNIFLDLELDHGVVTWAGGMIDCAPEYMYEHSIPV